MAPRRGPIEKYPTSEPSSVSSDLMDKSILGAEIRRIGVQRNSWGIERASNNEPATSCVPRE